MSRFTTTLLVITTLLVLLPVETYAFGAGDIPDFAYLNNKAFRHGDIEEIITELAKTVGRTAGGGGLLGFATSVLSAASGGAKFSKDDVKKVYFGNWLRDYSQAMDIAGLTKLSADTLVLIVSILGFLTFGFATEEFEVTADRLGVYLPVEHIDNPKGYAEKEGDARRFNPKLRPPVNPQELEIDPKTGMKNYMATENRGWDTSTAHIRRIFRECINRGRRAQGREGADLWEAYRLMGSGLHTMEDLLAHSNWCEIALRKMGHREVFCHVGDRVTINTPNGPAPPLVTGTFGSADFIHSLMGEATDHLSQASVVDLSQKMNDASQNDANSFSNLKDLLSKLPIGGGDTDSKMNEADEMKSKSKAYRFNPDNVAPPEVQQQLLAMLKWRDGVYRDILKKIEMVPGLSELIDNLTNALNAYVYTVLAPYLTPILQQVTSVLGEGSKAVIDSDDQYEVFNNPNASDPSHSLVSKDHFALILNEPAGKIAQIVVQYSVKLIVEAWFDNGINPDRAIDQILEAFHHPYYATGRSRIQQDMYQGLQNWVNSLGSETQTIIQSLTKERVREGKNKRPGSDNDMSQSGQTYGAGRTESSYGQSQGRVQSQDGGYSASQGTYGGGGFGSSQGGYGDDSGRRPQQASQHGRGDDDSYGGRKSQYKAQETAESYGGGRRDQDTYGSRRKQGHDDDQYGSGYGSQSHDERRSPDGYSRQDTYGSGRQDSYGSGRKEGSGRASHTSGTPGFGSGRNEEYGSGRGESYGSERTGGYSAIGFGTELKGEDTGAESYSSSHKGRKHQDDDNDNKYASGGNRDGDSYGSRSGFGQPSYQASYNSPEDTFSGSRRDTGEGGFGASFQTQTSPGYGRSDYSSNTSGRGEYGSEDRTTFRGGNEYGSKRSEPRGGGEYGSSEIRRSEESAGYGGLSGGYGGESTFERRNQEQEYRTTDYGTSRSAEKEEKKKKHGARSDDEDDPSPKYGRRKQKDDEDSFPSAGSGYRQEGSAGGYGGYGGFGGRDETYGAERLNLGDNSDEEKKRRHHKKRNDYD